MVERICSLIQTHVLETMNTLLTHVNLADTYYCNDKMNILMLIGSDYYWECYYRRPN